MCSSDLLNDLQVTQAQQGEALQQIDDNSEKRQINKDEEIRQAMLYTKQMKQKGKENRSPQEEKKYHSAMQLVAKNRDYIKQHGIGIEKA